MDRRLFPLAELAALAAIVAAGYTVVSSAKDTAAAAIPAQQVAPEAAPPPQVAIRTAAPLAAARPPVPLLLSPRPPYETADSRPAEATPEKGTTEAAAWAKAMIEADGYKKVRAVARAPDGRWRGLAMRGAVEIAVSVDDNGNVSAQ